MEKIDLTQWTERLLLLPLRFLLGMGENCCKNFIFLDIYMSPCIHATPGLDNHLGKLQSSQGEKVAMQAEWRLSNQPAGFMGFIGWRPMAVPGHPGHSEQEGWVSP